MAVENITLNLIPTGDTPSIHAAQYDVERPFTITLKEGADDFTPTGYDIELQVRKVDNNIVTVIPTSTSGNVVTFNTTEQMTACSGTNLAELQLSKDDQTIATLHFYLVVQRDVLAGGLTSQSEIYDLEEQIAAIVPEVIGDDYYNKEEVDEKIAEIPTFDPTNYYDKSETDALLDDKADVSDLPDMSNYYDKSETDALLDDKADVSDLPDMSNYYNKTEVDNKITDLYQIKIVSGSIVHITEGGNDIPVKSLVSQIVVVESGSGEKSPTNPYTISGFSKANIGNISDATNITYFKGVLDGTYNFIDLGSLNWSIDVSGRFSAVVSGIKTPTSNGVVANWITMSYSKYTLTDSNSVASNNNTYGLTTGANLKVKDSDYSDSNTFKNAMNGVYLIYELATPTTPTITPEQFSSLCNAFGIIGNLYTFAFGQTVYGGYFDNKGNLVATHGYIASYNGETINEPWVSSMDNYVPNTSPSTGAQVVYPLTSPITLAITSQDIPTLLGENNIFSNTGDVEVEYFTEKSNGIAELIKAFM